MGTQLGGACGAELTPAAKLTELWLLMRPLPNGSGTARGAAQSLLRAHHAELSTFCTSSGGTSADCMTLRGSVFAALLLRACFTAYSDSCRDSGERATLQSRVPAVYYPCEGIGLLYVYAMPGTGPAVRMFCKT